jgi:predicted transcriptional regulator
MIQENILEYIRDRLPVPGDRERLEIIAKGADVPYHTLLKIANGETEDPRVSTVQNLLRYFQAAEQNTRAAA